MKHSYTAKSPTIDSCRECNRPSIDHGDKAQCESCDFVGDCELHTNSGMLLCWPCRDKHISALIASTNETARITRAVKEQMIRYTGDFYNAKTQAIIDLKKEIDDDETIEDKVKTFQERLTALRENLQEVIFEADKTKYEASLEVMAIDKTLRDFGNDLRKEIRERLRNSDSQYKPDVPKPKLEVLKPRGPRVSPMDKMAESLAAIRKISKTEALELIKKGLVK